MNRIACTLFTVIFFLHSNISFAQRREIDSLHTVLATLHGHERINCLNELGKIYCNCFGHFAHYSRADSAELCVNMAYSEAVALGYKFGIATAVLNLAETHIMHCDYVVAQEYAEKAISLFKEIKAQAQLNEAYITLADALWYQGNISSEINDLNLALEYYKNVKDISNESLVLDWLSECYSWKGNFEKAYDCLQNQFDLVKDLSNPGDVLNALNRKQALYDLAEWDDSVASYSNKIIAYKKKMGIDTAATSDKGLKYFMERKWDSCRYYNNIMRISIKSNNGYDSIIKKIKILRNDIDMASVDQYAGNYAEALPLFMNALQQDKEKNFVWEELEVLLNITGTFELEGKDNDAILYGQTLLSLAQKKESSYYIENACKVLWEIYDKKKDSAIAYKYYLKYTAVKDSTLTSTYQRKLAVINELTKEKEQQIKITALGKDNKLKEAAIQKNVLIRNTLVIGLIVLILLGFIIYRVIDLKRKNEKLEKIRLQYSLDMEHVENEKRQSELQSKATELEMQALRAQMNPHFIFNCLSSINHFILKNKTEEASDYLTKFSRLIRMVLNNSKRSFISLEDELETLQLYLDMERLRFKDSFNYSFTYNNSVATSNIFIPPLLLQPFAENAIWHGLMHKQKGFLSFNFTAEEKFLTCIIADNGIGRKKAEMFKNKYAEKQKSMGLKITTERLSLLNSNSSMQTVFTIEDIIDENGNALGTRVLLKIFYREMMEV